MKNTRTKIQLLILAVTVILSIVAFMYLPDVAAVQPYNDYILEWIF